MKSAVTGLTLITLSCTDVQSFKLNFDAEFFSSWGCTFFNSIKVNTLKEIHLDASLMTGKTVTLQGNISYLDSKGTYLTLNDGTATLLVITTKLSDAKWFAKKAEAFHAPLNTYNTRIFGDIESGPKGLPFLIAHSLIQSSQ